MGGMAALAELRHASLPGTWSLEDGLWSPGNRLVCRRSGRPERLRGQFADAAERCAWIQRASGSKEMQSWNEIPASVRLAHCATAAKGGRPGKLRTTLPRSRGLRYRPAPHPGKCLEAPRRRSIAPFLSCPRQRQVDAGGNCGVCGRWPSGLPEPSPMSIGVGNTDTDVPIVLPRNGFAQHFTGSELDPDDVLVRQLAVNSSSEAGR